MNPHEPHPPKRLSVQAEQAIMYPSTNRHNLQQLKELDYKFMLCPDSLKVFHRNLTNSRRTQKEKALDRIFKLNNQRRAFYRLEPNAELDESYRLYKQLIHHRKCYLSDSPEDTEKANLIQACDLTGYSGFLSNKVQYKNQQHKMIKILLKNEIITPEEAEKITTAKTAAKPLYLCVSRNPLDYLMVSTNQSYTSCIGLESEHEQACYLGLAGAICDPNRALVFITTGQLKKYDTSGKVFRHFGYISRSWILFGNTYHWNDSEEAFKKSIYQGITVRTYPNAPINFSKTLSAIYPLDFTTPADRDHDHKWKSWKAWKMLRHSNADTCMIYLDLIGLVALKSGRHRYTSGGSTSYATSFNWAGGFDEINRSMTLDDLFDGHYTHCESCGEGLHEDDYWADDGYYYCESCYLDSHVLCRECNEYYWNEDDNLHFLENGVVCDYCFDRHYFYCEDCGEAFRADQAQVIDGRYYCEDCAIEAESEVTANG